MVQITGQRRPDRGTIGRSSANRDYRMSTYGSKTVKARNNGAAVMSLVLGKALRLRSI